MMEGTSIFTCQRSERDAEESRSRSIHNEVVRPDLRRTLNKFISQLNRLQFHSVGNTERGKSDYAKINTLHDKLDLVSVCESPQISRKILNSLPVSTFLCVFPPFLCAHLSLVNQSITSCEDRLCALRLLPQFFLFRSSASSRVSSWTFIVLICTFVTLVVLCILYLLLKLLILLVSYIWLPWHT